MDALLLLARARQALGDADGTVSLVDAFVRLAPGRQVAASVAGDLMPLLSQRRAALLAGPRATLAVTADESPLPVRVDGRDVGKTPLKVQGLVAGRHDVSVVHAGKGEENRPIDLSESPSSEPFSLHFGVQSSAAPELARAAQTNRLSPELIARLRAEAAHWKSPYLGFGVLRPSLKERETIEFQPFLLAVEPGALQRLPSLSLPSHLLGVVGEILDLRAAVEAALVNPSGSVVAEVQPLWPDQPLRTPSAPQWNLADLGLAGARPQAVAAAAAPVAAEPAAVAPQLPRLVVVRSPDDADDVDEDSADASDAAAVDDDPSMTTDLSAEAGRKRLSSDTSSKGPTRKPLSSAVLAAGRSDPRAKGPVIEPWLLWTGAGVGAAALVTGAILLLVPRSPSVQFNLSWGPQ